MGVCILRERGIMKILVKHQDRVYRMNEDGEFKCAHENLEIEEPCCTGGATGYIECACGGQTSVYCPDCNNEDLSDNEASE